MWWWWLTGCPKRGGDGDLLVLAAVAASDRAWDDRVAGGLGPVGDPLMTAWTDHRGDPALGWRLVRWQVALGTAATDPAESRAAFAAARADAVTCLDGDPLFAQRRRVAGWDEALDGLTAERAPCAGWGALAWVRWSVALGPEAASLDLPVIDHLVAAGSPPSVVDAARGLSLGTRPEWAGADRAQAEILLRSATAVDPDSVVAWADLYTVTRDPSLLATITQRSPVRPEDQGVWERLRP